MAASKAKAIRASRRRIEESSEQGALPNALRPLFLLPPGEAPRRELGEQGGQAGLADAVGRPPQRVFHELRPLADLRAKQFHGQREMGEDVLDRAGLLPFGLR